MIRIFYKNKIVGPYLDLNLRTHERRATTVICEASVSFNSSCNLILELHIYYIDCNWKTLHCAVRAGVKMEYLRITRAASRQICRWSEVGQVRPGPVFLGTWFRLMIQPVKYIGSPILLILNLLEYLTALSVVVCVFCCPPIDGFRV